MHNFALEVPKAFNLGPCPLASMTVSVCPGRMRVTFLSLQDSCSIHEYFCLIFLDLTVLVDLQLPFPGIFVPDCFCHSGVELNTVVQIPLPYGPLDVFPDLRTRGIEVRPVGVWLEKERIRV